MAILVTLSNGNEKRYERPNMYGPYEWLKYWTTDGCLVIQGGVPEAVTPIGSWVEGIDWTEIERYEPGDWVAVGEYDAPTIATPVGSAATVATEAAKWWTAGTAMHYDRVVSEVLLNALRPRGPLHSAVAWSQADPRLRDVQLRKQPKGAASWASFYVGLTSVLDIYEVGGQFRLKAHATHRAAAGFDPSWDSWQALDALAERWAQVELYLEKVSTHVHPMWLNTEGKVHALISNSTRTGFSVINREASISFVNQATKDGLGKGWSDAIRDGLRSVDRSDAWFTALLTKSLGMSPDFIAVDNDGRLLIIEAKAASAAAGITWGPAQVTFYACMYAAWLAEAGDEARAILQRGLEQRRALRLVPPAAQRALAAPPDVVPVLAIGPGIVSPEVWSRLSVVAEALTGMSNGTAPLEVCRLAADGTPRPVDLATAALSYPAHTKDDMNNSTYQQRARAAAVAWKLTTALLDEDARADGPYGGKSTVYPFCLPLAVARQNLLPEAAGAIEFFGSRNIQWHRGVAAGPTNHLVSSQVQCVNALFPMTTDAGLLRGAFADSLDIVEVLPLDDAFLTFEYNGGGHDFLGEGRAGGPLTRGANSTSTDAAFAYRTSTGTELALVE